MGIRSLYVSGKRACGKVARSAVDLCRQNGAAAVVGVSLGLGLIASGAPAQAALDPGVATLFTSISTDFSTLLGLGWTLFLLVVGGLLMFGLVRKVLGKGVGGR